MSGVANMPVYEYVCPECNSRFDELRPVSRMNEPARCLCGHTRAARVLSTFTALTRNGGEVNEVSSGGCGGGCTNCACGA